MTPEDKGSFDSGRDDKVFQSVAEDRLRDAALECRVPNVLRVSGESQ